MPLQPDLACLHGWGIHTCIGNPCQCLTILTIKAYFLLSNLNLHLKPFPLVLSQQTLLKSLTSSFS